MCLIDILTFERSVVYGLNFGFVGLKSGQSASGFLSFLAKRFFLLHYSCFTTGNMPFYFLKSKRNMNRHAYSLPISIQYPFVGTYSKNIWKLALSISLYQQSKHIRVFYCAKYRIKHILSNLFTIQFDSVLKDGHCLNFGQIDFKPSIQISLGPFPVLMSRFFSKHSKVTYIAIKLSKKDWFDKFYPFQF